MVLISREYYATGIFHGIQICMNITEVLSTYFTAHVQVVWSDPDKNYMYILAIHENFRLSQKSLALR